MRKISATLIISATVATGAAVAMAARCIDARVNNFAAVGGREEFDRQRAKHLERLRNNEHVTDPAVRAADAAAIDAEADVIGKNVGTPEMGEEFKRIK